MRTSSVLLLLVVLVEDVILLREEKYFRSMIVSSSPSIGCVQNILLYYPNYFIIIPTQKLVLSTRKMCYYVHEVFQEYDSCFVLFDWHLKSTCSRRHVFVSGRWVQIGNFAFMPIRKLEFSF